MDRMQAKEKINKLLALANDKGATASEKETALDLANKLASRYSFKIQKGNASTSYNSATLITYYFDIKCFNKKLVGKLLSYFGIENWELIGKKIVSFKTTKEFDVNRFREYYKRLHPIYNRERKYHKDLTADQYFYYFFFNFRRGVNGERFEDFYAAYQKGKEFAKIFNIGRR